MSKELASTESNAVAPAMAAGAWGAPAISSKDIVIPKIYTMQGLSQLVVDEKAKMGDFVDSMTNEIIGNYAKKPVLFIPFHLEPIWIRSTKKGGDFEFHSIEKVTPVNESMPYTEVEDGVEWKNEYCMNFYILRPEDMSLPYVISFKGMSRKAGKILATQMFVKNAAAGKIPPAFVLELSGTKEKNDKGTFITLNTKTVRESTEQEVGEAFKWFTTIKAGEAKAHEEGPTAAKVPVDKEKRF